MAKADDVRVHEVEFCGDVKSWADSLFQNTPRGIFSHASIEQFGRGNNKRQDLRVYKRNIQTPTLCGEVKLPGTPEGRSPYAPDLMQDAFNKADNIQAPYFFTWNVNTFVLFDRSKWQVPMIERRIKHWDLNLHLSSPADCKRPEVQAYIREKFLPEFFSYFSTIVTGQVAEWGDKPDEIFLRSLESHLDWPVIGTRDYLAAACSQDKAFHTRLCAWMAEDMQWTFDPADVENWRAILERAARTLCYVFCNRAIFYEAIRAKYPESLHKLSMPKSSRGHDVIYSYFRNQFQLAIAETGDYEPIFYPDVEDWAGALIFASPMAFQGWEGLLVNLAQYNFREIPYDIVGGIFQKLISPEERQKFGQFYTNEDIIDVINAFCIRRASDVVLDPACGSGSFLVRAYHRKAWLSEHSKGGKRNADSHKRHDELLREIFGCDIALFAAHLATLNLAARHIEDEENYPCIARGNFFEIAEKPNAFCEIPMRQPTAAKSAPRIKTPVAIPQLDAIIGNPPYVRQEYIPKRSQIKRASGEDNASFQSRLKNTKEYMLHLCQTAWPALKLKGRSDLHCYFWPVSSKLLKEGAYFGFLTSSSWLDVEYGFALQEWVLKHFKIVAVLESVDEPWFPDARVKTAVTILRRCSDDQERDKNIVKFVRLQKPLKLILGERPHGDESARQNAAESMRKLVEKTDTFYEDEKLRIIPISQQLLWQEGIEAGQLIARNKEQIEQEDEEEAEGTNEELGSFDSAYGAGKWGRFLRAPDLYFRLKADYASRFVRLGEIAEIKRGITSGCDPFFMPRDVTQEVMRKLKDGLPWNDVGLMTSCKRNEIENGHVKIVRAGDNTLHPIESEYVKPEVHSLMQVSRPVITASELDRVVLWVDKDLRELHGTYVAKYIRWGSKQTFESKKSKAVPVPERSTCASRPLWYNLTNATTGIVFWPMAQQYRHIIPVNRDGLLCNHNLFYLSPRQIARPEHIALSAVLNSTLVALFKTYYGRYAGTEGNLKTEVIDVNLLEVPDPRGVKPEIVKILSRALNSMQKRDIGHLVEPDLMSCHSSEQAQQIASRPISLCPELQQQDRLELDDAVLQLIGIVSDCERKAILHELYTEISRHFRQIRLVEIQKQEQRAGASGRRFTAHDLAYTIWDSTEESYKGGLLSLICGEVSTTDINIPEGHAKALGAGHMFDPAGVEFKMGKTVQQESYSNPEQAELIALIANCGIHGSIALPTDSKICKECHDDIRKRLADAETMFQSLAASHTGTAKLREQTAELLMHWFIHGRPD